MFSNVKLTHAAALAAALLVPAVAGAAASTTLYGGGATLPANAYVGDSWLTDDGMTTNIPVRNLTNPADAGSLFGAWTAAGTGRPSVSYCQTGSGTGRKVLIGTNLASGTCPNVGGGTPTGFAALDDDGNFSATDAPLSATEYNTFLTNKPDRGEPVQIPSLAGAIAIVYNNSNVPTQLHLTESQICQIFAGTITNWQDIKPSYGNIAIKVVYRDSDSGTSFNMSNHLSAVCPNAVPTGVPGWKTKGLFSSAFPNGVPFGAIAASGNGGVVTTVVATPGSIGYAEVSDAVVRSQLDNGNKINYATVQIQPDGGGFVYKKLDPVKHFKATFNVPAGGLKTDQVLSGSLDTNGRPLLQAQDPATVAGCLLLVDPNTIATSSTYVTPAGATDYQDYPIAAVTYLLGYQAGNGANTANTKSLLGSPYLKANNFRAGVTTVGAQTGFAYLNGVSGGANPTIPSVLTACIKGPPAP